MGELFEDSKAGLPPLLDVPDCPARGFEARSPAEDIDSSVATDSHQCVICFPGEDWIVEERLQILHGARRVEGATTCEDALDHPRPQVVVGLVLQKIEGGVHRGRGHHLRHGVA